MGRETRRNNQVQILGVWSLTLCAKAVQSFACLFSAPLKFTKMTRLRKDYHHNNGSSCFWN